MEKFLVNLIYNLIFTIYTKIGIKKKKTPTENDTY